LLDTERGFFIMVHFYTLTFILAYDHIHIYAYE